MKLVVLQWFQTTKKIIFSGGFTNSIDVLLQKL